MDRSRAIERLKVFEPRLRALGATAFYLFGSTARDTAAETSDLDLFIDYDAGSRFSIFELVRAKHMFEDELHLSIDLGTRDGLRPAYCNCIEAEAIQIF